MIKLLTGCLVMFSLFLPCAGQALSGTVRGTVRDTATHEVLSGTTIRVENRAYGSYSNPRGEFIIRDLPIGTYTLLVSMIGYETQKLSITITAAETTVVTISMKPQLLQTNEVVVTANKRIQAVQDVPISISIVDQRTLQQRNITRLDDALRYVPGINMTRDQINIRGSSGFALGIGSRVLTLIDGFPLLSGDNGDVKFDAIPYLNTDRIEVIKGAGSALYGTGALGGIVNIVTAPPVDEPEVHLRGFSGFYTKPTYTEWEYRSSLAFQEGISASYSQKIGGVGTLISGGVVRDEGFTDFQDSFRWNLFSKFAYTLSPSSTLSLMLMRASEQKANWLYWKNLDSATVPPSSTDKNDRLISEKTLAALQFNHIFSENFFMMVRTGVYRTHFENTTAVSGNDSLASTADAINTEIQCTSILQENILLTYGINMVNNLLTQSFLGNKNQLLAAGYFQAEYTPVQEITITAGGRLDYEKTSSVSKNELEFNPKLGVSWNPLDATRFRFSLGRGFRSPTIGERFAALRVNGLTVKPNPDLLPERSWSVELGLNQSTLLFDEEWNVDVSLFDNEFRNLIEPTFSLTDLKIVFQNITNARITGVEVGIKGWIPRKIMGVEASLTTLRPVNTDSSTTLQYRAALVASARLIVPIGIFQVQMDYRHIARYETVNEVLSLFVKDANARVPVNVVDARAIVSLQSLMNKPLSCSLNVRNLFNYYYTEISGNLAPTRSITLQVDATL